MCVRFVADALIMLQRYCSCYTQASSDSVCVTQCVCVCVFAPPSNVIGVYTELLDRSSSGNDIYFRVYLYTCIFKLL